MSAVTGTTTIDRIVEIEREMFGSVYSSVKAPCQDKLKMFEAMRRMHHSVLSDGTLDAHLQNLQRARAEGVNLMTLKYARMENQIDPLSTSPLIAEIVAVEQRWMGDVVQKYPKIFTQHNEQGFKTYLACELETLSDETLDGYHADIEAAKAAGRNLVEDRYEALFRSLGYESMAARNEQGE